MYQLKMPVKDEHIDFQDIVEFAKKGLNLVLAEYTLKFRASLKRGDQLVVTCQLVPIEGSRSRVGFAQQIVCNDKVAAEASFVATCVPAAGGRPFVPEEFKKYLIANPTGVQG